MLKTGNEHCQWKVMDFFYPGFELLLVPNDSDEVTWYNKTVKPHETTKVPWSSG